VPVVEDGAYGELTLGAPPPPSLAALDEDRAVVIHLNTFSKTLAPGLRLGWILASRAIVEQLGLVKQRVDLHTQNLAQLAVAEFVGSGAFDRHLEQLRLEHRARRDAMVDALRRHLPDGALRFAVPLGGLYIWGRLAGPIAARTVQSSAAARGVAVVAGEPFYPDAGGTEELRICFTSQPADRAARGAQVLGQAIQHALAHARPALAPVPLA
jgi:DNA-binding transcriptional MocR family regulator